MNLRHRGLGALLALGYLVGYLLVFVHFAVEQHGVCLEHDGAHHVDEAASADGQPADEGLAALPSALDDHCHLLNAVRVYDATSTRPVIEALLPLPQVQSTGTVSPRGPPARGAVWRYAPKQSPPAAS